MPTNRKFGSVLNTKEGNSHEVCKVHHSADRRPTTAGLGRKNGLLRDIRARSQLLRRPFPVNSPLPDELPPHSKSILNVRP
jgi:hypothetical protein